ncbi:hypothetical protein ACFE04_028219 [Oxalis oulophora]
MSVLLFRFETTGGGAAATAMPIRVRRPKFTPMAFNNTNNKLITNRKLPILLFDVMDTLVRDPFYQDVPPFFGMSFKEMIDSKHPNAWNEFEKGLIDENELATKFFKDGRAFDLEGLKNCMKNGYSYLDGIEQLLQNLKYYNYEMHTLTNYPIWYNIIEDKLKISKYMPWTFASCKSGKRKPDPEFYLEVVRHLEVDPENCIFIDNSTWFSDYLFDMVSLSLKNVVAANELGMAGLHFKGADLLRENLSQMGIEGLAAEDHSTETTREQ